MTFTLPDLPYDLQALQPIMSAETLELHHGKHRQAYVTKLNELIAGTPFADLPLEDIVRRSFGHGDTDAIFNNAGHHWNHSFFWPSMKRDAGPVPKQVEAKLTDSIGSVEAFKAEFIKEGVAQFGSGWVWLVQNLGGHLTVVRTQNGVNPLVFDQTPLLGCDVWEHAYYVDYRNHRPDYLKAFIDRLVDWERVASRLSA